MNLSSSLLPLLFSSYPREGEMNRQLSFMVLDFLFRVIDYLQESLPHPVQQAID
jgi:hypothetical protein